MISIKPESSTMNGFFKQGDEFYINRYEEHTRDSCSYHAHAFVELCYVASGEGFHIVDNREYAVQKGDFFIINHDIPHVFYRRPGVSLITYNMMFKPGFLDGMLLNFSDFNSLTLSYLFKNVDEDNYVKEDLRLYPREQLEFEQIIENIYQEYQQRADSYINTIRAYMILLIIKTMRCFKSRIGSGAVSEKSFTMIQSVISYLQKNYSSTFNLGELALKSFYSKNYLCTVFKETTGMTISQYLQNLRIQEACKLLDTTGEKASHIASVVGFSDYKAFLVCFRKVTGMTPKEYKKRLSS